MIKNVQRLTRERVAIQRATCDGQREQPTNDSSDRVQRHHVRTNFHWHPANSGISAAIFGDDKRMHVQVAEGDAI